MIDLANVQQISTDRRRFLQGILGGSASIAVAGAVERWIANGSPGPQVPPRATVGGDSVMDMVVPKIETVRFGLIGTGRRGSTLLRLLLNIDGAHVRAMCDVHEPSLDSASKIAAEQGADVAPTRYTGSDTAYRSMLDRGDIDAVVIATPWRWHTPMAVDALAAGKHVFVEVPAAVSLDECWQLVEASEKVQRNCMMLENVCYGRDELMTLNLVRAGVLGELLHGEAAYIHELRWQMKDIETGTGSWRTGWHAKRNANLYPTHGLGPIAQYMNINRGDRFDRLVSLSSPARGRDLYAQREFEPGHARRAEMYICGDMNTSMIRTRNGRTIVVQHDTTTPRPYTRHNLISGTNGALAGFPTRIALENNPLDPERKDGFHQWESDMARWHEAYDHPVWTQLELMAREQGGHGGMDFVMLWRVVYCLRNGLPLDQNVYDAAAWSAVVDLSGRSVAAGGGPQEFPEFTRGAWKTTKPLMLAH